LSATRKIAWGVAGLAAAAAGVGLLAFSLLPYMMGESGQQTYIAEHQAEIVLGALVGLGLIGVAIYCFKHAMGWKAWAVIVGVAAMIAVARSYSARITVPPGVQPVGNNFYVSSTLRPNEADTVMYHVYYRNGKTYEDIESQVSEYRLAGSDCLVFRGLSVVGRPLYAMCEYRIPVETYDTLMAMPELLQRARAGKRYRDDWRYNK
jgi:hypothetical protein